MMDHYEMSETKAPSQLVVEEDDKVVANAYPGQRTEGTTDVRTRVRVREASTYGLGVLD